MASLQKEYRGIKMIPDIFYLPANVSKYSLIKWGERGLFSIAIVISLFCRSSFAGGASSSPVDPSSTPQTDTGYTLSEVIEIGLKSNPLLSAASMDIEIESYRADAARAEKRPRFDFIGGFTRSRYDLPVTPISGFPLSGAGFPEFDNTLYDIGISFTLPLYRGGRIDRGITIAEMNKSIAADMLKMSRQELVYNLTSVYFKIAQLERLLEASEASVNQLEAHKKNAELFLKAGTIPPVELLKIDVELAHAEQNVINVKNNLENTHELLKTLMGIEETEKRISIVSEVLLDEELPAIEDSLNRAFSQRHDYRAVIKRLDMADERIRFAEGKRLPSIYLSSEYLERSGEDFDFKENWNIALRLSIPIFEGGAIRSEVNRESTEMKKIKEDKRSLRLEILREVKSSYLDMENARKRMDVSQKTVETARENLRIERLKFETGAGTSTDVIDAQTVLLRAETDYYQAIYDRDIAMASFRKAIGEDVSEEVSR